MVWLSALSRYILDQGFATQEFIDQWVNELEEYRTSLEPFTLEYAAEPHRHSRQTFKSVAHEIASADRVCSVGDGSDAALRRLGHFHRYLQPAAGDRQLHASRGRLLSCEVTTTSRARVTSAPCRRIPGYEKVDDPEARDRYQRGWNCELPTSKGLDNHEMVQSVWTENQGHVRG